MRLPTIQIGVPERLPWSIGLPLVLVPALVQVGLGGDPRLILIAVGVCLLGIAALNLGGVYHAGSLLAGIFVVKYMGLGLWVKTILGQPLDSNLLAPDHSFLMILGGTLVLVASLAVACVVPVGRPLFSPTSNTAFLRYLSILCAVGGVLAWVAHREFAVSARFAEFGSAGTGAFGVFRPIFYMGIIAGTARVLILSDGRRSLSPWVLSLIAVGLLMPLIDSQKIGVLLTVLSYLLTTVCFRRYITFQQIFVLLVGGVIGLAVAVPFIHHFRAQLWRMTLEERIAFLMENWDAVLSPAEIQQMRETTRKVADRSYTQYLGENSLVLDRFVMLEYVDPVVAGIDRVGTLDYEPLSYGFQQAMPGFLFPNKPRVPSGDRIIWHIGMRPFGFVGFNVVPHMAGAYAAYYGWGLLLLPILYLPILLIFKKVGWMLGGNIFMIYLFVRFGHKFADQPFTGLVSLTIRNIPVDIVILLGLVAVYYFLPEHIVPRQLRNERNRLPDMVNGSGVG